MRVFESWRGVGQGYGLPGVRVGKSLSTPNMWGRMDSSPTGAFRFKQGPDSIMAPGARNTGDSRVQWGATRTADEISRDENFKF